MSVTIFWYGNALLKALNGEVDFDTSTIKVMLCTSAYVPDQDAHIYKSSVTNEVTGLGYTAGGATLASKTIAYTAAVNLIKLDAADVTWSLSTITARYAVAYVSTGVDGTSVLLFCIDFGENKSSSGSDFSIVWDAGGIGVVVSAPRLLQTGQTTVYHAGDDGAYQKGAAKPAASYDIKTTGSQSGTTAVDCPHYAAATLAFVAATKKITDSANGLATILTGDTIRVRGSTSNDGIYTVATGGVAGEIVTTEALVDGIAGAYVSLYKRALPSNNTVRDLNTGLEWLRYTTGGPALKLGPVSDGTLSWYDATKCYTLHPAAADVAMIAGNILRVTGTDESTRYHPGDLLVCAGFANAVNNLPGYPVVSVSFTGGNTDIVLNPLGATLVAEAAAGSRSISLVCRSIFGFAAAANAVALGGFTDWRIPNDVELKNLCDMEAPTAAPEATAFPSWPLSDYFWSATTLPSSTTNAMVVYFYNGNVVSVAKAATYYCALVRG